MTPPLPQHGAYGADSQDMSNATAAARIVANARNLRKDALHTSVALDLVAPVAGRRWLPMCCLCVDAAEVATGTEIEAYRLNLDDGRDTGCCASCERGGRDTLVASVMV